jgi:hypothetical protein
VPITVLAVHGIPENVAGRVRAAVEAAGSNLRAPHEAWITADPLRGGFKVLLTGPQGLERSVSFVLDEQPGIITAHVRAAVDA